MSTGWGRLAAFVLPLGLDTFAMSAAVGTMRPTAAARGRLTAVMVAAEAGMPVIGLGLGKPLAHAVGATADYVAAAVLVAVGAWMLLGEDEEAEEQKAGRLSAAHGWALLALGISISLDELAVGFSLGLTKVPVTTVILAIAVQALVAAQLGLRLGARIGEEAREWAERVAAIALIGLGIFLIIEKLR